MKRADGWIGDLVRILDDLEPDDGEMAAIARLLPLGVGATRARTARQGRAWRPPAKIETRSKPPPLPPPPPADPKPPPEPPASGQAKTTRLVRIQRGDGRVRPPSWRDETDTLDPPAAAREVPEPEPLLKKEVRRAILSSALSVSVEGDAPDMDRLLDQVVRRRPLKRLPRLPRATLRYGVQVLVDIWAGMIPFLRDQQQLVAAIESLVSSERLAVLSFAGCPSRGTGDGPRPGWSAWSPPPPGTAILVLSDLGIGGPLLDGDRADTAEWIRFARHARHAGFEVSALVPYAPSRWPAPLAREMNLIYWSERLNVRMVSRR